jgi:murein DD-endopeptidase MepM/ murein hydrolase activator NlpD
MNFLNESNDLASPIDNFKSVRVTGNFGDIRSTGKHKGTDFAIPSGTKVYAIADGVVKYAQNDNKHCGGKIEIVHKQLSINSLYCHIRDFAVSSGEKVAKGQLLGYSGGGPNDPNKGRSSGAHLHFSIKRNGNFVNPMPIIKGSKPLRNLNTSNTQGRANVSSISKFSINPSDTSNTGFSINPSDTSNIGFSINPSDTSNTEFSINPSNTTINKFSIDSSLKNESLEKEINRIKFLLK